ncbi:MAG: hypothetical protein GKR89_37445 [Candidatus Latescibacteria bacterium]|nr:hypothetical protein [Candidatus Latescibacterota bacterium]
MSNPTTLIDARFHPVTVDRLYTTQVAPAGGHLTGKSGSHYMVLELIARDGSIGLGEISDLEASWACPNPASLAALLREALEGVDACNPRLAWERLCRDLPTDWHPEFRRLFTAAVDMALLDLRGKALGVPVYALLGGLYRRRLPISWVAYIRGTDLLSAEIEAKVEQGFNAFKLKVGADFALDCVNVQALRQLAGEAAYLKVDASGEWGQEEAIDRINRLAELGVDAVETPIETISRSLAKDHPERIDQDPHTAAATLARLRSAVPIPIIEHVADFADAFALALVQHRAVDIFNIVPGQAGSLHRALRLAHLAEAGGIGALLGSTVELGPGTAAALHLGLAAPAVSVASDLVGPGLLNGDIVQPRPAYRRGHLHAPQGVGLGVELQRDLLEKHRTPIS